MDALDFAPAARGDVSRRLDHSFNLWSAIRRGRRLAAHRRAGVRGERARRHG